MNWIYYALILVFILPTAYSYESYTEINNIDWSYANYHVSSSEELLLHDIKKGEGGPFSPTGTIEYPIEEGNFTLSFRYPDSQDYTLKKTLYDQSYKENTNSYLTGFHFSKYRVSSLKESYELPSKEICRPTTASSYISFDDLNNVFEYNYIGSTLNPLKMPSGSLIKDSQKVIPKLLEKYYYMKAFAILNLSNGKEDIYVMPNEVELNTSTSQPLFYNYQEGLPYEASTLLYSFKSDDNVGRIADTRFTDSSETSYNSQAYDAPYVLLKDSAVNLRFDLGAIKEELTRLCEKGGLSESYCGDYVGKVSIIPIDGKCDLNSDGYLSSQEEFSSHTSTTSSTKLSIAKRIDSDGDGIVDSEDKCPNTKGYDEYNGCPTLYSLNGTCQGSGASFDGKTYYCSSGDNDLIKFDSQYYYEIGQQRGSDSSWFDINAKIGYVKPYSGSGRYLCVEDNKWYGSTEDEKVIGYCDLVYKGEEKCFEGGIGLDPISLGETPTEENYATFYKHKIVPYSHSCDSSTNSETKTCYYSDSEEPLLNGNSAYIYSNCEVAPSDTQETIVQDDGRWISDDDYNTRKIEVDPDSSDASYINFYGDKENFTLPYVDETKYIKIIEDGVNTRNDTIRPQYIALKAHLVRNLDSSDDAQKFVKDSYELMKRVNIEKHINTTSSGNSKVTIKLDIPKSDRQNLTLYHIVPKSEASSLSELSIPQNPNAQLLVLDKDPVIGWYFNDSEDSEEVEYEIPGDSEGGTIIITQEPILFNEGELVINYRESDCNPDEAHLFDLEDLLESKILKAGAGFYKVCVAHISENLLATDGPNTLKVGSYDEQGKFLLTDTLDNLLNISTTNTNLYWDIKMQRNNPDGTYSCLGSLEDNRSESLFGDCGYKEDNRIWLHLGDDIVAPKTELIYPYLAHTVKATLEVDNGLHGSDLDYTKYCIKDDVTNCSDDTDFITYDGGDILLECEYDWGCVKEVFFYSADEAGNKEPVRKEVLTLLDEGSSCQSDCTAQPAPNRYLKGCRNINGCSYYAAPWESSEEQGEHVATKCNLHTKGSLVEYNQSHDIKCPKGPISESRFSLEKLFYHNSICDNFQVIPYNVIVDGKQVRMKVVHCITFD